MAKVTRSLQGPVLLEMPNDRDKLVDWTDAVISNELDYSARRLNTRLWEPTIHLPTSINATARARALDRVFVYRCARELIQGLARFGHAERVVAVVIAALEGFLDVGFGRLTQSRGGRWLARLPCVAQWNGEVTGTGTWPCTMRWPRSAVYK